MNQPDKPDAEPVIAAAPGESNQATPARSTSVKPEARIAPAAPRAPRDEALVERFFRRVFESMGAAVDRRFGRDGATGATLTTSALVNAVKRAIDERVYNDPNRGRLAPHLLKIKLEWGTHSEAAPEVLQEIEREILAGAIDHINDARLRTLAPVRVETATDLFTVGIAVEPTFGEFQDEIEAARANDAAEAGGKDAKSAKSKSAIPAKPSTVRIAVRLLVGASKRDLSFDLTPGGRRINIGRAKDNELQIDHPSVSKIHAAARLNSDGSLVVADTGSTNGTQVNGHRIAYGEARSVESGDTVRFGDVEARFKFPGNP